MKGMETTSLFLISTILALFIICLPNTANPQSPAAQYQPSREREVDCETIWWRPGHGKTFYESNPTYYDDYDDTSDWDFSTPEEQGMNCEILEMGLAELESSPYLFSILIIRNNTIVVEAFYNGSNFYHSNNIHSASKSMLPAMVGIAIREGYIDSVHQKVADFLPEYFPSVGLKRDISLHDLMTVSAGLWWVEDRSEYWVEKTNNWVRTILRFPLVHFPGTTFNYSTGVTHVISAVIASATGMSTCEFAHQYLFLPIGITAEHWGRDLQAVYSGGYNLYMTPREMAKFGLLYLHNGEWEGQQIVPQWMIAESLQAHMHVDPVYNYGYNWWLRQISGYDMYLAWGFGGQYIYVIPELDLVFVTTADTKNNPDGIEINEERFIRRYIIPSIEIGPLA